MSNGFEWGSVADWISGIGSMAAVFAALIIAFSEWRRATRNERATRESDRAKQLALTREALRLTDDMRRCCEVFASAEAGDERLTSARALQLFVDQMVILSDQLRSLQAFPNDDPRLFVEIGRLRTLCEFEDEFAEGSTSYVSAVLRGRVFSIDERRAILVNLATDKRKVIGG